MSDRSSSSSNPRHGLILGVVCLELAAVVAAMSSLNVGLPDIARDTHATQTQLVWVIDAYSLAFAALLLPGGALGDRYGRRIALIAGLVIFGVNVVLALLALVGTLRFVPESADPHAPPLDVTGAIVAVLGLTALVFSV